MINFRRASGIFALTALCLSSTLVHALECDTFLTKWAYDSGKSSGINTVERSWSNINNCDHVDAFEDIVLNNLERYETLPDPDDYEACSHKGVVDGILEKLEEIKASCN